MLYENLNNSKKTISSNYIENNRPLQLSALDFSEIQNIEIKFLEDQSKKDTAFLLNVYEGLFQC